MLLDFDFSDDDQLRAALVEAYGEAAEWIDLERLIAEARDPQTSENNFRRYFLNQPTSRADAWLPSGSWAPLAAPREVPGGTRIVLGFDGSYNNDSTALIGCTVDDEKPYLWVVGLWEKPPNQMGWLVPREEVKATVAEAFERYQVVEFACDPPGWHREIEEWELEFGSPPLLVFETNEIRSSMAPACSRFYTAVVNGELAHDGNPRLAHHLANAVVKETPDGAHITKDGRNSPRKIDAAVAAIVALHRAAENKGVEPWLMVLGSDPNPYEIPTLW